MRRSRTSRNRAGFGILLLSSLCLAACKSAPRASENPVAAPANTKTSTPATADDAKRFVQRFYDWYVPYAASHGVVVAAARPEMKAAMAPELLRVLMDDYDAQSRNSDEIVGLDGDPVTNSQDPCDRYEAVRARKTGDTYWVGVRGVGACRPHGDVDTTVQLTCSTADSCSIFNFQYAGHADVPPYDLRSLLMRLREERVRPVADAAGKKSKE